jgi:hypothetical protein
VTVTELASSAICLLAASVYFVSVAFLSVPTLIGPITPEPTICCIEPAVSLMALGDRRAGWVGPSLRRSLNLKPLRCVSFAGRVLRSCNQSKGFVIVRAIRPPESAERALARIPTTSVLEFARIAVERVECLCAILAGSKKNVKPFKSLMNAANWTGGRIGPTQRRWERAEPVAVSVRSMCAMSVSTKMFGFTVWSIVYRWKK